MQKMLFRYILFVFCFLICQLSFSATGVISQGYWVKLNINSEGVYRIEYQDLVNAGFSINNIDPRNFKLVGHQGKVLSEINGSYETGLPEIPIYVKGEDDGKFDQGDYILFYGAGAVKWNYNASSEQYEHRLNLYSNNAFLYFGISPGVGKRMALSPEISGTPSTVITKYTHVFYHDSDMYNPVGMGRTWLGEKLGNETLVRSFNFTMPSGSDDSAYLKMVLAGGMKEANGTIRATINGKSSDFLFLPISEEYESFRLTPHASWYKTNNGQIAIKLELTRPNTQSAGWLDYIEGNVLRSISVSKPLMLRNSLYHKSVRSETRFESANYQVWNVSSDINPMWVTVKTGSGYDYFLSDSSTSGPFVLFNPLNCLKPQFSGKIDSRDILDGEAAELIIITHPNFKTEAERLAAFRRASDKYKVKVVTPQQIYDEYSASQQDITAIRDYLKDEFQKSLSASTQLKYVLLFGATSYDPKNRVSNNSNFIPVYQFPSYNKAQTFCLDDYYGYFEAGRGSPSAGRDTLWLSVGRITARTQSEAKGVVDKLIRYYSPQSLGPWRQELTFVCDDVDDGWEVEFIKESEKYASSIDKGHPDLLLNKIYADAYKQVSTGNTEKYPDVSAAIDRTMNSGSLFVNYQGHGGEKGWAQEAILTIPMINAWTNKYTMPVLFTATCEFSRFDDPHLQSGGELALLNPNGGAIALMSTTRLVFVSGNSQINYDFWTNYGFPRSGEPVPTVGDLYKRMKNRPSITSEDNKFALLGDPSMKLAFPENKVIIDSINGKSMAGFTDTIKAFSVVTIKGHIDKRAGGKFNDFNGTLWVKVFDKPQTRFTLDNDKNGIKTPFKDQNSYIFKGVVSVTNGDFQIVFPVPKDISYMVDSGKISMYAHNGVTDANGARKFLVGSSISQIIPDEKGPLVKLYMNDSTFISGGKVQKDALFIAHVYDESGLNSTGAGIGRDMVAILNPGSKDEQEINLNDYFSYDLNSYKKGKVKYPFKNLKTGKHTIRFKVWDIHNNSAEAYLEFVVLPEHEFLITESSAVPNPFRDEVNFYFTHNLSGEDLIAEINVFDVNGRLVSKVEQGLENTAAKEMRLSWNGRSQAGNQTEPGFYIFRVDLRAEDGRKASFNGKIIKH